MLVAATQKYRSLHSITILTAVFVDLFIISMSSMFFKLNNILNRYSDLSIWHILWNDGCYKTIVYLNENQMPSIHFVT